MKTFATRACLFALLCVITFGGWAYALYHLERESYFREVSMPEDVRVAVCGDSHLESGFDTRCWPGSFNFALSAITLDQLELKVYGLLKENPDYHGLVIVDISPEKLFNPNVDRPLVTSGSAGKRLMLHLLYPEVNRRPMDGMVKLFRDAIFVKRTKKAWKAFTRGKPYSSSVGGVGVRNGPVPSPDAIEAKEGFKTYPNVVADGIRRKAETINGFPPYVSDTKQHEVIVRIVRTIRAHGCRPVIVSTPLHPRLLSEINEVRLKDFDENMSALTNELEVPYVNALCWAFPDNCWLDGNHLNARGAIHFTRQLKKEVENVL